jgi:hypothetical protein
MPPQARLDRRPVTLGEMVHHVSHLVADTSVDRHLTEHRPDRFAERRGPRGGLWATGAAAAPETVCHGYSHPTTPYLLKPQAQRAGIRGGRPVTLAPGCVTAIPTPRPRIYPLINPA